MTRFQPRLTDRETLTAQEILDAVREHAGQMPAKCSEFAHDEGPCLYRSHDGTNACFVGAFLTDEEAQGLDQGVEDGDGLTASQLTKQGRMPERLVPHTDLLSDLQFIHDFKPRQVWPAEFTAPPPTASASATSWASSGPRPGSAATGTSATTSCATPSPRTTSTRPS